MKVELISQFSMMRTQPNEEANGTNCTILVTLLKGDCSAFPVSFIFQ